jgi:hypothetical protein
VDSRRKIVIFDASSINCLADEPSDDLKQIISAKCGVRITLTSIAELIATKSRERRQKLLETIRGLLRPGCLIAPSRWVIRHQIRDYFLNPGEFDWTRVDVSALSSERVIAETDTFMQDEFSAEVRAENNKARAGFNENDKGERDRISEYLKVNKARRPISFEEYCRMAFLNDEAWTIGERLITATAQQLSRFEAKDLFNRSSPMKMIFLCILWSHYRECTFDPRGQRVGRAGRDDLMSAVYLPYCDVFVTDDAGQYGALCDIAEIGEPNGKPLRFADFSKTISVW